MMKRENGAWNAAIELINGCYEYKLFVDGAWMENRSCEVFVEKGPAKQERAGSLWPSSL
jgi:hypothetical protein